MHSSDIARLLAQKQAQYAALKGESTSYQNLSASRALAQQAARGATTANAQKGTYHAHTPTAGAFDATNVATLRGMKQPAWVNALKIAGSLLALVVLIVVGTKVLPRMPEQLEHRFGMSKTTILPGTAYSPPPPPVPAAPLFDPRAVDAFDLEKETKRRKKGEKQAWSSAFTRHHRKHAWHSEAEQTKEKLNVMSDMSDDVREVLSRSASPPPQPPIPPSPPFGLEDAIRHNLTLEHEAQLYKPIVYGGPGTRR